MKNLKLKYLTDVILFVAIFIVACTGTIMAFFTDSGPSALEADKYFLELHRHQWGNIHFIFSLVLVGFAIIHLILEWGWIKVQTKKILKSSWNLITLVLVALLILIIFYSLTDKESTEYSGYGKGRKFKNRMIQYEQSTSDQTQELEKKKTPKTIEDKPSTSTQIRENEKKVAAKTTEHEHSTLEEEINGRMSLIDIQNKLGISARTIADRLELPSGIDYYEKLGRLRRVYGFTMQKLRDIVAELVKKQKK